MLLLLFDDSLESVYKVFLVFVTLEDIKSGKNKLIIFLDKFLNNLFVLRDK